MKKIILGLAVFIATVCYADVKISQLPLGSAATTGSTDSFPYVQVSNGATQRLDLSDLINLPSMVSTYATLASPTFTGTVTIPALKLGGTSTSGYCWTATDTSGDGSWQACSGGGGGSGTVTSVSLAAPAWLTVSGSPVTTSGTLTLSGTSETANYFLAAPNGSSGALSPRAIVAADIPTLNQNTTGTASNVTATSNSTLTTLSALTTASNLATVGTVASGTWNGSAITATYGGSGLSNPTAHSVLLGEGSSTYGLVTPGTSGYVLTSNGSTADPTWQAATGGFTNPMTTAGDLIVGGSGGAATRLAIGSNNYVLTSNGSTATWAASSGGITALTGDVTASGTGSVAATVAKIAGIAVGTPTGTGNVVFSNSPTLVSPALGTPVSGVATNLTGTAAGLTAGTVTTNANLSGDVTSSGNTTTLAATTNSTLATLSGLTTAGSLATVGTIGTGTWHGTAIGSGYGGTGISTSSSTGVPSISSGTWSVNSTLPTTLGGLGGNFGSATGALSISSGTVSAGTLGVANGGTGAATLASNAVLTGNGTSAVGSVAPSTVGSLLASNGTTWNSMPAQYQNFLNNPSFEFSTATTGWTAGSGVTAASYTTSVVDGSQAVSLTLASTTASELLWYQNITPTTALTNVNGEATLWVNTTASNVQVCPLAAGSALTAQCVSVPTSGTWSKISTSFIFPSSGTVGVAVYGSASISSGTVYVDKGYVGIATNLSQLSQGQFIGAVAVTGCSNAWQATGSSFTAFGTVTGCTYTTYGAALAPSTNLPAMKFASLQPGNYVLQYEGLWGVDSASGSASSLQFTDGTNTAIEVSGTFSNTGEPAVNGVNQSITYTTAQSNVTFSLTGKNTSASATDVYGTAGHPGVFKLYYFPTQIQTGYRADTTPASWSGVDSGCSGASVTSTTFANVSGSGCTLTQKTNRNFGTVSNYSTSLGNTLTFPRSGNYWVCAAFGAYQGTASSEWGVQMTDGSTVIAKQLNDNGSAITSNQDTPIQLCGVYTASSTASTNIYLQAKSTSGSVTFSNYTDTSSIVNWSIVELDAPMPAPYLTGSVTSTTSGTLHAEYAIMGASTCSSGTCTLSSNTPGISSIAYTGTGQYTVSFTAGTFSGAPSCNTTAYNQSSGNQCYLNASCTSSSCNVLCVVGTTLTNSAFNVNCLGPH